MIIDDPALLRFLQNEETRAVDNELNNRRETALDFYEGKKFGNEVEGRSQLVSRDVAEVVDYMTVSIMRTFVSGDHIVEFEPLQQGQDDAAQEATERVHWNFLREQDGYGILHDGIKAGLIEKTGVWKSWVERDSIEQRVTMNAAQIEAMETPPVAMQPVPDAYDVDEITGEALQLYDVVIRVPGAPKFRDAAIPNEEFFVSSDARTLDGAAYVGNLSRVSIADLVAMGYSEADLADVWSDSSETRQLSDARDQDRTYRDDEVVRDGMHRVVTLREEYIHWVYEGVWQLVRVHRVGNTILSVEPAAFQPYTIWSPFPMQHRLVGDSLADKTMDIQVTRSTMMRHYMDAQNIAIAPRTLVDVNNMDDSTLDDLLDVAPGGLIRYRGQKPEPYVQPFTAGPALEGMQFMAGEKESRTGITRLNQGLDADALNKTATGTALMQASGQQIEEYIARNAANAIGEMFEKKLRLMIAGMAPHAFKIDGEFKQIDPSQWPEDMRFGVRVGLGSGNKDRRIQGIMMLKQTQAEAMQVDPRLVTPEKAFQTAKALVAVLGMGTATQYFNDPATMPPQEQQPDPAMMEAQAKAQERQADMQFRQQEAALKLQLAREEAAAKIELEKMRAQAEAELAIQRMDREFALKREDMLFRANINANMAEQRQGGSLAS